MERGGLSDYGAARRLVLYRSNPVAGTVATSVVKTGQWRCVAGIASFHIFDLSTDVYLVA
jgi:hypothetical protein